MGWHFNGVPTSSKLIEFVLLPGRKLGWFGVDLFFVLSGYLIGHLIFLEHIKTGRFNGVRFLARRALKLWPIFYLFLAFGLATHFRPWREWLLPNAFHIQNYLGSPIGHLWSLAVEEHFYLIFALAFVLWGNHPKTVPRTPAILLLVMLFAFSLRCIFWMRGVSAHDIQTETHFRADSLAAGVMLAYLKIYNASLFATLAQRKMMMALIFVIGVTVLASCDPHGAVTCTVGYTIAYITSAACLLFCHRNSLLLKGGPITRVLAWIGLYSYALYIWHVVLVKASDIIISGLHLSDSTAMIALTVRYLGAIVLAVVITKSVEIPFLRLRDRLFPALVGLSAKESFSPPGVTIQNQNGATNA